MRDEKTPCGETNDNLFPLVRERSVWGALLGGHTPPRHGRYGQKVEN